MRRLPSILLLLLGAWPCAGDEAPLFTNEDLAREERPAGEDVATNEDLARAEGNLTYSDPAEDVSYENALPRSTAAEARERRRNDALERLKPRYRKLQRRSEQIEAELPEARDAAERELGPSPVLVNGVPVALYSEATRPFMPAHEHVADLEAELADVRLAIEDLEDEVRRLGFGAAALAQR